MTPEERQDALHLVDELQKERAGKVLLDKPASEIPYMFGTLDRTPPLWPKAPATGEEAQLSDAMVAYWTSFAKTGRPSAAGAAAWKPYAPQGPYMAFRDKPEAASNLMPGMFVLHEQAVCRRKAAGDLPWNWNVGLVSPVLPGPTAACQPRP